MDLKTSLLTVADAYCQVAGKSKARLATRVANDGKFFLRIEGGGGFTVATYERAMGWMSDNWPDGAVWPAAVPRPKRMKSAVPVAHAADTTEPVS